MQQLVDHINAVYFSIFDRWMTDEMQARLLDLLYDTGAQDSKAVAEQVVLLMYHYRSTAENQSALVAQIQGILDA